MPKKTRKISPYPVKAKPPATRVARQSVPLPIRKLVQEALEGLKQPGAIPSVILQRVVEKAFALGAETK